MKKILKITFALLLFVSCTNFNNTFAKDEEVIQITLSSTQNADGTYSNSATINNETCNEYDYCWHIDPDSTNTDVKNVPGVYYTGTQPDESDTIYIAHDVYYYPELDVDNFVKKTYGDEQEWVYYYTNEELKDYVFSTLPIEGSSVPTEYMHSETEAYQNAVLHITVAGTYELTGSWHGQIAIDLGEDAFDNPECSVTLILNNVNIECTVGPGICFYNVYEVDNTWEENETYSSDVDLTNTGANIIIADDSTNNVTGANIYRLLKTKYKDETQEATDTVAIEQKKYLKIDAALYSYQSLSINGQTKGNGILNITSTYEGLDTELHLAINSGTININSDNDGINCNEDDVSVIQINGGNINILAGLGSEGDGIDSNGYIVINGGTIISIAKEMSDNGIDSSSGTYIYGGTIVALGSSMQEISNDTDTNNRQPAMYFTFAQNMSYDSLITITDESDNVVFAFDGSKNEMLTSVQRSYQGMLISSSNFEFNKTYHVYLNGTLKASTDNGIIESTNSKVKNATQLQYTSIGQGGFNPNGGTQPDIINPNNGELPTDFDPTSGNQPGNVNPNNGSIPTGDNGTIPTGDNDNNDGQQQTPPDMNNDGQQGQTNPNDQTQPTDPTSDNQNIDPQNLNTQQGSTDFVITYQITSFTNLTSVSTSTTTTTGVSVVWLIVSSVSTFLLGIVLGYFIRSKKKTK